MADLDTAFITMSNAQESINRSKNRIVDPKKVLPYINGFSKKIVDFLRETEFVYSTEYRNRKIKEYKMSAVDMDSTKFYISYLVRYVWDDNNPHFRASHYYLLYGTKCGKNN
jgi:hypothetical protein